MNSYSSPLKTILSKHFFPFWKKHNHQFPIETRDSILENVTRFLDCRDPNVGYTSYICLTCNIVHKVPFSCKSRFCSSCGKVYADNWANGIADSLIDCNHRHAVFSLPIEKFIGRLLSHIPPKHFKMVRRFGLYSRRSKIKIPKKIRLFKIKSSWAERIIKAFSVNPLICRKCSSPLHLLEIFHVKYGVIAYNNYSP